MEATNFIWGTAASAVQTDGSSPASDWWEWEQAGRAPASGDGNGHATRFADDFTLLREWGFGHHRLSLDWARLEPEQGKHDQAAVEHYRQVLTAGRDAGLNLWVCLLHTALPTWFARTGGFLDPSAERTWAAHVEFVAETFGDLVYGWKPVNGPTSHAVKGYLTGEFPPGHQSRDELGRALKAIHKANFDAALRLRSGGQPVASVQAVTPLFPDDNDTARQAAGMLDQLQWASWLGFARHDHYADAFDYHGFSYYYATSVDAQGNPGVYPSDHAVNALGYAPWASGIQAVLSRLATELPGSRFLVSELGYGGQDDAQRAEYLTRAVGLVWDAIRDGVDVAGIFFWTGIDNYEWTNGFDVPFGLFDTSRAPRPSAYVVRDLIAGK
nr:family 1 glycosylhydrolase [Kibdelosporangium sp. MJ126-NF4]CEL19362.1 Beta-glucosidase [Kibdelosporangium sp. MJ126-NF4]CTQ94839.1 Beta-glucosidase (EC 3.2.1.21) [Kibdelosporangium sp. MJ126-NF4]